MKEFDKSKVFHTVNAEEAKKYIGLRGWFADTLDFLKQEMQHEGLPNVFLRGIGDEREEHRFTVEDKDEKNVIDWGLFYPAEEPAQYRPYITFNEAKKAFGKIILRKDGRGMFVINNIYVAKNGGIIMSGISGNACQWLFETCCFEDGSPVGVKI